MEYVNMGVRGLTALAMDEFTFNREFLPGMTGRFRGSLGAFSSGQDYRMLLLSRIRGARAAGPVLAAAKLIDCPGYLNVRFLETALDQKGHGYGRRLFAGLFAYAATARKDLVLSQYTAYGRAYLMPEEDTLAEKYYPQVQVYHEYGV